MPQLAIVMVLGVALVVAVAARPVWVVLATGVFLFVQSAVIRLDAIPDQIAQLFARADEAVLLLLVMRTTIVLARDLRIARKTIPKALIALAAFIAIGVIGAIVNQVPIATAGAGLYLAIKAGLWLYVDDLDRSHAISQGIDTPSGSFWHAIMHRREGDFSNSKYWLRMVGSHPVIEAIGYDPYDFVDACQSDRDQNSPALVEMQRKEWKALFDQCLGVAPYG